MHIDNTANALKTAYISKMNSVMTDLSMELKNYGFIEASILIHDLQTEISNLITLEGIDESPLPMDNIGPNAEQLLVNTLCYVEEEMLSMGNHLLFHFVRRINKDITKILTGQFEHHQKRQEFENVILLLKHKAPKEGIAERVSEILFGTRQ